MLYFVSLQGHFIFHSVSKDIFIVEKLSNLRRNQRNSEYDDSSEFIAIEEREKEKQKEKKDDTRDVGVIFGLILTRLLTEIGEEMAVERDFKFDIH